MNQQQPPRIIRCYRRMGRIWRERRFHRFVQALSPSPSEILLDVGGYPINWFRRGNVVGAVDVLNLTLSSITDAPPESPEIRAIEGDARCLPFHDKSYDIVFSNSVIEHVGTLEDQEAFAREARRVGKRLWIQTPAKECPVEPHYLGLFIHWFPRTWHVPLARWTSLRGLTKAATLPELREIALHTRLMTRKEFAALFPDCEIWTERLMWIFPKSYVAIWKGDSGSALGQ